MDKERTKVEAEQSEVYCAVQQLLDDPVVLRFIKDHRYNLSTFIAENEVDPCIGAKIEDIYTAFEPRALRIVNTKMYAFPYLREEEREDIFSTQKLLLFKFIYRFHWENFKEKEGRVDHAIGAFTNYISRATGNYFAADVIRKQKESPFHHSTSSKIQLTGFIRPIEDDVIDNEFSREFLSVADSLGEKLSETTLAIMIDYISGISFKDLADKYKRNIKAVRSRVKKAKYALLEILREKDLVDLLPDSPLTKDVRYFHSTREELLEARRAIMLKRYPSISHLLPQKALHAAKLFYGLDGFDPLYNYDKVMEASGMSLTNVRVSVSTITRIMLGVVPIPPESIEHQSRENLYKTWLSRRDSIGLKAEESQVLDLHFGEKISLPEIGRRLSIHHETARRRLLRALNRIEVSIHRVRQHS